MFRKKKANVPLTTVTIPAPPKRPEYESYQEGKHLVVQFIRGDLLRLVTADDVQINFCDEINVFKDIDGATHKIVTSQIQHVQETRAVRCGKCGRVMLPYSMNYHAEGLVAQGSGICTKCGAYIRVMDDDT